MNNYNLFVINEILFVGVRMLNVIDNILRSIKHIQNKFFGPMHVIMTYDFLSNTLCER
jgi:hypothetical protein